MESLTPPPPGPLAGADRGLARHANARRRGTALSPWALVLGYSQFTIQTSEAHTVIDADGTSLRLRVHCNVYGWSRMVHGWRVCCGCALCEQADANERDAGD